MRKYKILIDGEFLDSTNNQFFVSTDPATGEPLAKVPRGTKDDINLAVIAANKAFESYEWQNILPAERGRILLKFSEIIREEKDNLARLESLDSGKPMTQAYADVEVAARYCEYYGGIADKIFGETIPVKPDIIDFTLREPFGVSAQIIPWNYPIQILMRGIAPAIASGNTVVIKPAEDTPMTALEIAQISQKVEVPKGVLNVVTGYGNEAGVALASHPGINQLTFTGSVPTGVSVMKAVANNVVPLTLELGGKSPNIVFADADLDEAANSVVNSITQNAGQTCSAGSRLIIEESIHDDFISKIIQKMEALTLGHGINDPDIGPIVSKKQLTQIKKYMEIAKQDGLTILTGGEQVVNGEYARGNFFKPTVIDNVPPEHPLAQEEVFGPVLTVLPFKDIQEAITIANGTDYGLIAGIWTNDVNKSYFLAKKIKAGQIYINNYGAGGGVELPFGGTRKSGFGREKGLETLRYYTAVKNVALKIPLEYE